MDFLSDFSNAVWMWILMEVLIIVFVYLTIRTKFIQIRKFITGLQVVFGSRKRPDVTTTTNSKQISSFQAFCTGLGGRVGSGNLAGVAVALHLGGPGAIFWMWIIALFGMTASLFENTLAQVYKVRVDDHGTFRGGAPFYIQKGLKSPRLALVFATLYICGTFTNAVQANTIAQAFNLYEIPHIFTGIGLAIGCLIIVMTGVHSLTSFSEAVVPFMALGYLLLTIVVTFLSIEKLPKAIESIFICAFTNQSSLGYSVLGAMINGARRSIFSNEAGMGSAPNAAALASPFPHHPVTQGFLGMIGVFVDTIIICSCTAFVILLSDQLSSKNNLTGIELLGKSLSQHVGSWSEHFIAITTFFFAFTSILATYYYGESNLKYIFKENKIALYCYRGLSLFIIFFGAIADLGDVWAFADLLVALLAIINIYTIVMLSGNVIKLINNYENQLDMKRVPHFDRHLFPFFDQTMENNVWNESFVSEDDQQIELITSPQSSSIPIQSNKNYNSNSNLNWFHYFFSKNSKKSKNLAMKKSIDINL